MPSDSQLTSALRTKAEGLPAPSRDPSATAAEQAEDDDTPIVFRALAVGRYVRRVMKARRKLKA